MLLGFHAVIRIFKMLNSQCLNTIDAITKLLTEKRVKFGQTEIEAPILRLSSNFLLIRSNIW